MEEEQSEKKRHLNFREVMANDPVSVSKCLSKTYIQPSRLCRLILVHPLMTPSI